MIMPHIAPYGTWQSPISFEMVVSDCVKLNFVDIDKEAIFYDEGHPKEKGKTFIVKKKFENTSKKYLPDNFNVRTTAHEYGGKSFFIKDNDVFFVNFSDQRIYKIDKDYKIEPITFEEDVRYADIIFDKKRNLIFCVQEKHQHDEVINSIIKIDLTTKEKEILLQKHDFYSSITLSPDKKKLAFLCWDHPNMPWDGTYLMQSEIKEDGSLLEPVHIAGGKNESIFQPMFSPDNVLYFVSDRTNYYNIYYFKEGIEPIFPYEAEFGYPQWLFGFSTYCFVEKDGVFTIYCSYIKDGKNYLAEIDPKKKTLNEIKTEFSYFFNLKSCKEKIVFIAASEVDERCVVFLNTKTNDIEVIKRSRDVDIDKELISLPETIEFPTKDDKKAFGFYYPPNNPNYVASKDELPPLIVLSHGGPTAQCFALLNLEIQFWTSRGFGVCDVNYSGSTGYGREYRNRLRNNWGILDVEDCSNAALYLSAKGLVDKNRLIIKGGSAGGYTTLASLTFKDVFKAGACYYGVSDLEALALHTHKFESHYLDRLIGPYPERKDLYYERSPIHHIDKLSCPIILFQGDEDKVVPPEQSQMMYDALLHKKIPTAYLLFKEEKHGFRNAENIKKAIEAELYFYSKIFGFEIKEKIEPIKIDNL